MKRKILCGLSLLLVAALVLASCGAPVTEKKEVKGVVKEPEKKAEEVEEVVEEVGPQYGGRITGLVHCRGNYGDPPSWDTCDGMWFSTMWVQPHLETLLVGDLDKYGPRGTGEYPFQLHWYVPQEFIKGMLCESWEVTPDKIVFHIRKKVNWTGNANIGMEPRELTADDVAFSLNRFYDSPTGGPSILSNVESIYAEGDTVVVETSGFNANWVNFLGIASGFAVIYPPEVVKAGASEWKNQVGTGPFILTDYVMGSQATWKRNPYYWDTTTINGKEYPLPFIDEFVAPIIPDVATQIAALRTGKLDYSLRVAIEYVDTLATTSPDLIRVTGPLGETRRLALQTSTSEYFTNRDIRRAMMIGTDLEAIRDALWPGGVIHAYPLMRESGAAFTPLEELPPEARELYDYNPEKAKQMLADAGYPDGFEVELVSQTVSIQMDLGAMIVDQWSRIGVTVDLKTVEAAVWSQLRTSHEYKDALIVGNSSADPAYILKLIAMPGSFANEAEYDDPYYTENFKKAMATIDLDERNTIFEDLAVRLLSDVAYISFAMPTVNAYCWPWLKNHYGELAAWGMSEIPILTRMWIDQDLKAEMGY